MCSQISFASGSLSRRLTFDSMVSDTFCGELSIGGRWHTGQMTDFAVGMHF
jgi:hypothetical protein